MSERAVIACIGAGRMGRGIAQCVAYAGHEVRLLDAKEREPSAFDALRQETLAEVESGLKSIASPAGR